MDGPISGERFRLYVEKALLRTLPPGDIVVMDNLASHKSKALRNVIRSVVTRLFFLPKYRPTSTRSSSSSPTQARLRNALRGRRAMASAGSSTPSPRAECRNYFLNAGMNPPDSSRSSLTSGGGGSKAVSYYSSEVSALLLRAGVGGRSHAASPASQS